MGVLTHLFLSCLDEHCENGAATDGPDIQAGPLRSVSMGLFLAPINGLIQGVDGVITLVKGVAIGRGHLAPSLKPTGSS